jgi:AcrR family transcriptional regulator
MPSSKSHASEAVPRIRNAAQTQARILQAAQRHFSRYGYVQAGLRDIAAEAGINVALVARYFGSKEKLFEAAVAASVTPDMLWAHPREQFGKRVVGLFLEGRPEATDPLLMLVQAAADPVAKSVAMEVVRARILEPLAEWLGEPEAEPRAAEILALCAGFFTYRNLLPLAPFTGAMAPSARAWLERALQDIVDGNRAEVS